jgi:hypothetical protein
MTVGKLAWGVRVQDAPNKIGAIGSPRRILAKIRLGFGGIFPKFGASTHRRELSRRATNQFAEVKKFKLLAALPGRCITMDELEDHPIFSLGDEAVLEGDLEFKQPQFQYRSLSETGDHIWPCRDWRMYPRFAPRASSRGHNTKANLIPIVHCPQRACMKLKLLCNLVRPSRRCQGPVCAV